MLPALLRKDATLGKKKIIGLCDTGRTSAGEIRPKTWGPQERGSRGKGRRATFTGESTAAGMIDTRRLPVGENWDLRGKIFLRGPRRKRKKLGSAKPGKRRLRHGVDPGKKGHQTTVFGSRGREERRPHQCKRGNTQPQTGDAGECAVEEQNGNGEQYRLVPGLIEKKGGKEKNRSVGGHSQKGQLARGKKAGIKGRGAAFRVEEDF